MRGHHSHSVMFGLSIVILLLAGSTNGTAQPFCDFDDGTLQGWTKHLPFNGDLDNPGFDGNPGGFMHCGDTMAMGGRLDAVAPNEFTGDLSQYLGIEWDEFLYECSPPPGQPTFPILVGQVGADTTVFEELWSPGYPTATWRERYVPFDSTSWVRTSGLASFEEVLQNVIVLRMNMDCNGMCYDEAGIDNIGLAGSPHGACCFSDGSCEIMEEDTCAEAGGTLHPEWQSCEPNRCPQPPGPCCFYQEESCQILQEEDCVSAGGIFLGVLYATCDEVSCTVAGVDEPNEICGTHLFAGRPNPFRNATVLEYELVHSSHLSIRVYDVSGRQVRDLLSTTADAGRGSVKWDGRNEAGDRVSPGTYFCRMTTDSGMSIQRMILVD